jgi:hypothetical protein
MKMSSEMICDIARFLYWKKDINDDDYDDDDYDHDESDNDNEGRVKGDDYRDN